MERMSALSDGSRLRLHVHKAHAARDMAFFAILLSGASPSRQQGLRARRTSP